MVFLKMNMSMEKIVYWIRKHLKKILSCIIFFILLGLSFIAWSEWREEQNRKLQDSLYELQTSLNKVIETQKEKKNKSKTAQTFVFSEEIKNQLDFYEQTIRQNHKSIIAATFAMDLADLYYRHKEEKKAKEFLSLFVSSKSSSSLYHLLSFQLAAYYMDGKECNKALTLLKSLSKNKKALSFHLESNLQQALCLEHLGFYEQALHKYEQVINQDPKGYTGRLAKDYKALLILDKKLKKKK